MKTSTIFLMLFAAIFTVGGCKKEGSGKKAIEGTVYFHDGISAVDDIAPGASVFITYGSKKYTGTIDETVTTDSKGAYIFKGLKGGDYFIAAEYITSHGFTYTSQGQGQGVSISADKDKLHLNLRLY